MESTIGRGPVCSRRALVALAGLGLVEAATCGLHPEAALALGPTASVNGLVTELPAFMAGRKFEIDGNDGWCAEPWKSSDAYPDGPHDFPASSQIIQAGDGDEQMMRAGIWYALAGGAGKIADFWPANTSGLSDDLWRYAVMHGYVARCWDGEPEGMGGGGDLIRAGVQHVWDLVWPHRGESFPGLEVFSVIPAGAPSGTQHLIGYHYTPTGSLSLTKASADTAVTSGNPCYSLAGITYGVFSDEALASRVGTLTCAADGTTGELTLAPGPYWVKEDAAGADKGMGYLVDSERHRVEVASGTGAKAAVSDVPIMAPLPPLAKADVETVDSQGQATLSGARLRLDYYAGLYAGADAIAAAQAVAAATATWETGADGTVDAGTTAPVEGAWPWTAGEGDAVTYRMPLGTLSVTEVAAPGGYLVDTVVRVVTVEDDGTHTGSLRRTSHPAA